MSFHDLIDSIKSEEFGNGIVSSSAYATAWAARIRNFKNPVGPAFPSSLDWIRHNQNIDGSWGHKWPNNILERLISTLIAIIVLKTIEQS